MVSFHSKGSSLSGLEKFTQSSRQVLSLAHQEAEQFHHPQIRPEHIFAGSHPGEQRGGWSRFT